MGTIQQFDVIATPAGTSYPYFVVLQSDLLSELATRVVAPLVDASKLDPLETLWPKVSFNNNAYVVLVPLLQSLRTDAGMTALGSLTASSDAIVGAARLLFDTAQPD
ncbi:MAG TPA: CcdB family protein [Rhizomicrobium sp.]|jgi:toxin CcdB